MSSPSADTMGFHPNIGVKILICIAEEFHSHAQRHVNCYGQGNTLRGI